MQSTARSMWLLTAAVLFLFQGDTGRATKSLFRFFARKRWSLVSASSLPVLCRDETRRADEAHTWTQLSHLRTIEDQL